MQDLKLFRVILFYKDPELSMLLTHGGHSGGVHERTEFIPAQSAQDAISLQWEKEMKTSKEQSSLNSDIIKKKREGKDLGMESLLLHCPRYPAERERWRAEEIKIPGFKINITEDLGDKEDKKPQEALKPRKWWQRIWV